MDHPFSIFLHKFGNSDMSSCFSQRVSQRSSYSPAGACATHPSLSAEANSGLGCMQAADGGSPGGDMTWSLKAGNPDCEAQPCTSLLVDGLRTDVQGEGTVTGAGRYGAFVRLIDGRADGSGADKVRIQIWDKSAGGRIDDAR